MAARKSQAPETTDQYLAALEKGIRQLAYNQHLFTTFRHFVELSALALSNAADPSQFDAREAQYLKIVAQYTPEQVAEFPKLFGLLVMSLEQETSDVLGVLYHRLELHNEQVGQFFTPFEISRLLARMSLTDREYLDARIAEHGFIRVQEPCVGSGSMVLALAEAMREAGINYQRHLHVTAIDIDIIAVHMAYIQCTLLHIPAVILHGNSLSMETWGAWRTLAHTMGGWEWRLAQDTRQLPTPAVEVEPSHPELVAAAMAPLIEVALSEPLAARTAPSPTPETQRRSRAIRPEQAQLTLF